MTLYFGNDDPYYGTYFDVIVTSYHRGNNLIIIENLSEFDQEIPQSHIAGQTTAPRGRAKKQSHDTRKTIIAKQPALFFPLKMIAKLKGLKY